MNGPTHWHVEINKNSKKLKKSFTKFSPNQRPDEWNRSIGNIISIRWNNRKFEDKEKIHETSWKLEFGNINKTITFPSNRHPPNTARRTAASRPPTRYSHRLYWKKSAKISKNSEKYSIFASIPHSGLIIRFIDCGKWNFFGESVPSVCYNKGLLYILNILTWIIYYI